MGTMRRLPWVAGPVGSVGWLPCHCWQCHALLQAWLPQLVLVPQEASPGCAQVPRGMGSLQGGLWVIANSCPI